MTLFLYKMFNSLRLHLISKGCAHFYDSTVNVHDSQAYRNIEIARTRECISFSFDPRHMLLSLQMGFSFVGAAVVSAILENISGLKQSSETTPRCLKLLSFYLYLFLGTICAVCHQFGLLGTGLHLIFLCRSRLSTRASSSCSSSARASMS